MKFKDGVIITKNGDEHIIVSSGEAANINQGEYQNKTELCSVIKSDTHPVFRAPQPGGWLTFDCRYILLRYFCFGFLSGSSSYIARNDHKVSIITT